MPGLGYRLRGSCSNSGIHSGSKSNALPQNPWTKRMGRLLGFCAWATPRSAANKTSARHLRWIGLFEGQRRLQFPGLMHAPKVENLEWGSARELRKAHRERDQSHFDVDICQSRNG